AVVLDELPERRPQGGRRCAQSAAERRRRAGLAEPPRRRGIVAVDGDGRLDEAGAREQRCEVRGGRHGSLFGSAREGCCVALARRDDGFVALSYRLVWHRALPAFAERYAG